MNGSVNLSGKGKMSHSTQKPKNRKKTLSRLFKYILEHKLMFFTGVILTILSSVLQLFGPKISGLAIKEMDVKVASSINLNNVYKYSIWLISVYILAAILSYLLSILMVSLSQKIIKDMRRELYNHIVSMPVSFFDKQSTGDIISRMSYDIDTVNTSLSSDVITIASSIISIVGSFIMMLTIEPLLVLVFAVTIPFSILYTRFMQKRLRAKFRLRSKALGEMNGYAEEMITGLKSIKAYSNEEDVLSKFEEYNDKATKITCEADILAGINGPGVNFVNNFSLAAISVISSIMYMNSLMDIGQISSFVLYSRKFSGPINEIANIFADIESALAASERIFEVLDLEEEADYDDSIELKDANGEIEFKNVKFGYLPNKEIIHGLNLHVDPGSLVAIVGPTGAGKTTIINLLMRFYDVSSGEILLDGTPINKYTRKSIRRMYSMVLQDTWLRKGTILDNVRYGKPDATLQEVQEACKAANIDDYIISLPNGYDTILNEGGDNISKGQKQLLTIARAMLLDNKMLILDEATSNVDTSTEMKIQDAMRRLMENKTCFVIAHRLSTIRNADTILVIKDGDIVEKGTHVSLIEQKGVYSSLYYSQFE